MTFWLAVNYMHVHYIAYIFCASETASNTRLCSGIVRPSKRFDKIALTRKKKNITRMISFLVQIQWD